MEQVLTEQLLDFYNQDVPGYILGADNNSIKMIAESYFAGNENNIHIVTREDLANYAPNQTSLDCIGSVCGDHRMICNLAEEFAAWFEFCQEQMTEKELKDCEYQFKCN